MTVTLFDRYVHAVGRRLPKRLRADVQAELHSLLMDALQDRIGALPDEGEAPEEDQVAILEAFGPPVKVAEGYMPPKRYIVGPRLYDLYRTLVPITVGALTIAYLVLFGLRLWEQGDVASGFLAAFGEVFGGYLGAVLAGIGSVTVTFYVLERVLPEAAFKEEEGAPWDPRTLPPVQDAARIEVGGLIAETVFAVVGLIVLNLFPQWVGVAYVGPGGGAQTGWTQLPLLTEAFVRTYLPMIDVLWLARIGLNLVLLRQGRWERWTRAIDLVMSAFAIYILSRMLFGPAFLSVAAVEPVSLRETLAKILLPMARVALGIGLIATFGDTLRKVVVLVRGERGAEKAPTA
jgi:hypothetical protein